MKSEPKDPLEIFTDRETPQKVFNEALDELMLEMPLLKNANKDAMCEHKEPRKHVFSFYGFAGLGKTTLLEKLKAEVLARNSEANKKQREIKYVSVDLEGRGQTRTSSRGLMKKIMNWLSSGERYNISEFPRTLWAMYLSYQKGGDPFEENLNDKTKEKTIKYANIALDFALNFVPFGNYIGIAKDMAKELIFKKKHISLEEVEEIFLRNLKDDENGKEKIKQMKNYGLQDLEKKLPEFFSEDLKVIAEKYGPFVFFIDTYEYKSDDSSGSKTIFDDTEKLLQVIISEVDYVVWVIAGREKLCGYDERRWGRVQNVEEHVLENLSDADIKKYMNYASIDDSMFPVFSNLSQGIPYILSLLYHKYLDLYDDRTKAHLDPNNYNLKNLTGENKIDSIEHRYLQYFNGKDKRFYYSLLSMRSWTDEQIKGLKPYLEDYDKSTYEIIKKMSIVKRIGEDGYAFQDSAWNVMMSSNLEELKEIKETTEEALLKYYVDIINASRLPDDTDVIKRIATLNIKEVDKTFAETIYPEIIYLIKLWRLTEVEEILSAFEPRYNKASDLFKFRYNCAQFRLFTQKGYYKEAGEKAKNCRELADKLVNSLDDEEFDKIDLEVKGIEAKANFNLGNTKLALEQSQQNLEDIQDVFGNKSKRYSQEQMKVADCLFKLGNWKESRDLYKVILNQLREFGANREEFAMCYSGIAKDLMLEGKYEEAIAQYDSAYNKMIGKKEKETPDTLNILLDKQVCFRCLWKYYEAEEILDYCKVQFEKLGSRYEYYAMRVVYESACWFLLWTDNKKALEQFNKAYTYYKEHLSPNHQQTLESLYGIYNCYDRREPKTCAKFTELYEKLKNDENFGAFHPFTVRVLKSLGRCLEYRNEKEALAKYEECYKIQRQQFGEESPIVLDTLENVATIQCAEESLKSWTKIYELRERLFGCCYRTCMALYQKAECLFILDRYDEALDDFTKFYENGYSSDSLKTRVLYRIIGCLYELGRFEEAHEKYSEVEQLYQNQLVLYDGDPFLYLKADTLYKLKKYNEALKAFTKYNEIYEKSENKKSDFVLFRIADSLYELGRYSEALENYTNCYELQKSFGTIFNSWVLDKIAICLYRLSQYDKALEVFSKCLEGFRHYERDDISSEKVFDVLYWKTKTLRHLGRYNEALEVSSECCEHYKKYLSENSENILVCRFANMLKVSAKEDEFSVVFNKLSEKLDNLQEKGKTSFQLGRYDEALEIFSECYDCRLETWGNNSKETLDALYWRAETLFKQGRLGDALSDFSKCYERGKIILTDNKERPSDILCRRAEILSELWNDTVTKELTLGKTPSFNIGEEALKNYSECYEYRKIVFGVDNEKTLDALYWKGFMLENLGNLNESLEVYSEYYIRCKIVFGDDNNKTQDALFMKAFVLRSLKRYEEALADYSKCYELTLKYFSEDEVLLQQLLSFIASILHELGREDEAMRVSNQADELDARLHQKWESESESESSLELL